MSIVLFARTQQRTLLVAAVGFVAAGAFGAGIWLGTQPLPGAGSAREALAAENRPIALVGSNRATTAADTIEMIPSRSTFGGGRGASAGGPTASDTPSTPGPADPQDPTPSPSPEPPTGPTPIPIPTEPVVGAIEDALNGVIESVPTAQVPSTQVPSTQVPLAPVLSAPVPSASMIVDSITTIIDAAPTALTAGVPLL